MNLCPSDTNLYKIVASPFFTSLCPGLEKMYFSREDSYISHYFLCISLLKNTKFPTKWSHFPGRSFLISTFFPTMIVSLNSFNFVRIRLDNLQVATEPYSYYMIQWEILIFICGSDLTITEGTWIGALEISPLFCNGLGALSYPFKMVLKWVPFKILNLRPDVDAARIYSVILGSD